MPLSPAGWRQALALRRRFLGDPSVSSIYSSPLQRAHVTAQQLHQGSWGPIQRLDELREINCGQVDGLSIAETRQRYAEYWEENQRQENENFRWPGGESYRELRERSLAALENIAKTHPGRRVLVVTHCGLISQVMGWLHGLSPAQWEKFRPGNASLTELDWGPVHQKLVTFDDRSHLQVLTQPEVVSAACR